VAPRLIATRNKGKLRELHPWFAERGLDIIDLAEAGIPESPEEDALEVFDTFEENALAKARYFFRASGLGTFADDSGLVVDWLGGAPGVMSKRWSGRKDLSGQALDDENNRLLIERLRDTADRRAHYVCAAAYVDVNVELVRRGEVHGRILDVASGTGGFGYDPFFWSTELGRSFGDTTREEKARVNHRMRAFSELLDALGSRAG
jgi:XTP/dITP diphosphohydrolase